MRYCNIEGDIVCCKQYGFDAIELKYNIICNYNREQIKDLLWKNDVRAGSIGALWIPVLQDDVRKSERELQLRSLCDLAEYLEADYIMILPNREVGNAEWRDIEEDAVRLIKDYSNIAEEYNVNLAMEIMGFSDCCINTIDKSLEIINRVGKDNLGLVYDFYHILGMKDLGEGILGTEGKNIFSVHVNDGERCSPGVYYDDHRLWLGEGALKVENQIDMLKRIGYKGPFSVEVYQQEMWEISMEACYKKAQNSMDRIEKLLRV